MIKTYHTLCLLLICLSGFSQSRPNVVVIITDDQGYGDLGVTGNPHVRTPTIDQLARESIQLANFYVSPVCAPTRSSLMTGRYSLRTGVHDTYNGGSIMATSEVTIAEMLRPANYRSGIFGKWHLGDNYPSRPQDQGFDESVIHLAGGIGQVGDVTNYFQGDSSYFNPVLWHNGEQQAYSGYCSDVFADQAVNFIRENKDSPFFCYLSFNAPHTPLQVPGEYYQMYQDIDPAAGFAEGDPPLPTMTEKNKEDARKVYAMVTNIDDNVKKVLNTLDELNLADNTLVIFLTDNGPQQPRYRAGLRGQKSSVYRGGVRVPCFFRYPARFGDSPPVEVNATHMDILPTLSDICRVPLPKNRILDGKSLLPLLQGDLVGWRDRPLFFSWTRQYPELYHNVALQQGNYKLVRQTSYDAKVADFELYDVQRDPYEQHNLIADEFPLAQRLKQTLDEQFFALINAPNLIEPPRIVIGSERENPVILSRNDASGERGIWAQEEIYGKWQVRIATEGYYTVLFRFLNPVAPGGTLLLQTGTLIHRLDNEDSTTNQLVMKEVYLPQSEGDLTAIYEANSQHILPFWIEVEKQATPESRDSR